MISLICAFSNVVGFMSIGHRIYYQDPPHPWVGASYNRALEGGRLQTTNYYSDRGRRHQLQSVGILWCVVLEKMRGRTGRCLKINFTITGMSAILIK